MPPAFWLLMCIALDCLIVYVSGDTMHQKEKANKWFAIILSYCNQMSHAHVSMFPWTTGQWMNKLTCHSRGFKGQNRILLSIERVGESNSETLHPISITPCFRFHGNWLISLPLFSLNSPGWCAIVHDRHCSCELLSPSFRGRAAGGEGEIAMSAD